MDIEVFKKIRGMALLSLKYGDQWTEVLIKYVNIQIQKIDKSEDEIFKAIKEEDIMNLRDNIKNKIMK